MNVLFLGTVLLNLRQRNTYGNSSTLPLPGVKIEDISIELNLQHPKYLPIT